LNKLIDKIENILFFVKILTLNVTIIKKVCGTAVFYFFIKKLKRLCASFTSGALYYIYN